MSSHTDIRFQCELITICNLSVSETHHTRYRQEEYVDIIFWEPINPSLHPNLYLSLYGSRLLRIYHSSKTLVSLVFIVVQGGSRNIRTAYTGAPNLF